MDEGHNGEWSQGETKSHIKDEEKDAYTLAQNTLLAVSQHCLQPVKRLINKIR